MIRLRVWANARPMGWLGHAAADFFFEYEPEWLAHPGAFPLAPQFALAAQRYTGPLVRHFFDNLLPEGEALQDIMAALQLRNASRFDVLGRLGQELPGVLALLPEGAQPARLQSYRPLPLPTLSARLACRQALPLLVSNQAATMSLAGAQDKIGLRLDEARLQLYDSVGPSPTTHILKPDTRQARYAPSAINEYACMRLAHALKLPVPPVWLLRVLEAAYVVRRYDRALVAGDIVALHQIDGCQLLGQGAGWKYERSGGLVSLPRLAQALRDVRVPGADLLQFQRWVMFNYLIGNADAHAKNLSLLVSDRGYRLAPCTTCCACAPMATQGSPCSSVLRKPSMPWASTRGRPFAPTAAFASPRRSKPSAPWPPPCFPHGRRCALPSMPGTRPRLQSRRCWLPWSRYSSPTPPTPCP
ncbi:HipA domain-containing protein [Pulveribacter suum]|uniref:HipA domain-containing protein n=1 Tax=Pulveribacter suum TaxID=2116657 RepID=UPI001D0589EB|nr:HipA domain-containing protein [Pulveribacter suum]